MPMTSVAPDSLPPVEHVADALLLAAYEHSPSEVFGDGEAADLEQAKAAADLLVAARFAKFADEGRTQIEITNAGRYWAVNGGFLAYLKEEPAAARGGRQRNPELESIRLTYMKLRLTTFWWGFGISIVSLVLSLISLSVAYLYGGILR